MHRRQSFFCESLSFPLRQVAYRAAIIGPLRFQQRLGPSQPSSRLCPPCSTTRLPAPGNTGTRLSTGAMLRKNSTCQIKAMAKSKSMNTPLTAIAVAECERSEEGEFDHRSCVGASEPSESTTTLPDFANAAMPRR